MNPLNIQKEDIMNKNRYLILGLFLIVVSQADLAAASICKPAFQSPKWSPRTPYLVSEVKQEGVSLPDNAIHNTWKYTISWKPIRHPQTGAVVKTYVVHGNACKKLPTYTCTDARCTVEVLGCTWSGSWIGITADYGVKVAGVRFGTILKPGYPCD